MEDWKSMNIMKAAHVVGVRKLDELGRAVSKLKEGDAAEAIGVFEATLRFFEEDLDLHFRHEEQALFPVLAKLIGRTGPIGAMVEEHESLWHNIETFADLVSQLKGPHSPSPADLTPRVERTVTHIVWTLTSHIQKEDSMLFPLAEKTLDQAARREVDENLETVERLYSTPHHP